MNKQTEIDFLTTFNQLQEQVFETACDKGWWDDKNRSDGEIIALIHSELSEGLEWLRKGNKESDHIAPFLGIEEEYADVIIRIMDHAEKKGLNISGAILAKMEFNKNREYKHGGKLF